MINSLIFYRNWFELAELQTDGELRLAFYDAIFRYVFDGEIPPDVGRDGDKVARAARFAFLTVQPIIDRATSDRANGLKGGRPPKAQAETPEKPPFREKGKPPKKPPFPKKKNPLFIKRKRKGKI